MAFSLTKSNKKNKIFFEYINSGFVSNVITNLLQRLISISTYCEGFANCGDYVSSFFYHENSLSN
jgi:hypothetical protein